MSGLPRGLARLTALAEARPLAPAAEAFYFLRHGQTACNARRIFQDLSEPLDATGEAQARQAAALLAAEPLAAVVHSDLPRVVQTAGAVLAQRPANCAARGLPHERLRERHFGHLIGSSSAEIDWDCRTEGGETLDAFVERSRAGLAFALDRPGPVLVVAHGGTLFVLAALLGVPVSAALMGNALPLRFDRAESGWRATPLRPAGPAGGLNLA